MFWAKFARTLTAFEVRLHLALFVAIRRYGGSMTTVSRYKPPVLNGHEVAYKGKRYWVVKVTDQNPLDWVEAPDHDLAIYDKLVGYVMAVAKLMADGMLKVTVPAQVTDHRFTCSSLREAMDGAAHWIAYLDRHGWG